LLAWQENDGVWTIPVPADPVECGAYGTPVLRVPGAKNPDLSPAPLNPGPRPPCGNPGNPTPCPSSPSSGPARGPSPQLVRSRLKSLLAKGSSQLRALHLGGLLRKGKLKLQFNAPSAGTLSAKLSAGSARNAATIASGSLVFVAAGRRALVLKLARRGAKLLAGVSSLDATLRLGFTPKGSAATNVTGRLTLTR
jgi:hypothetical protein